MLEALRGFVGSWVAKIFLGVLIASFAVWGIAGEVFGPGSSNAVATVGETKVPPSRFVTTYYAALENVRRTFGRQPTRQQARQLGLERQALAQVVSSATLDEYARRLGVTLSDEQLARLIGEQRSFQDAQGRFDRLRFENAVRNARTNEQTFIEDQNRAAVRAQIGSAAVAGDLVPEVFEQAAAEHRGEQRVFDLIELEAESVAEPPAPGDEQLKAFFDARTAEYRAPELRTLSILKIEPSDIAEPEAVDAAEVEAEYQRRRKAYVTPERRAIQQLPFRDREAAEKAVAALADGATFETVVSESGVAPSVVDLGKLERSRVPDPALAEAAFALELNGTSGIVDGRFGPVLVRVTEIEPEQVRPLAEVEGEIREQLALQDAAKRIATIYEEIEDARAGGAATTEIAAAQNLGLRTVAAVDAGGRGPDGQPIEPALPSAQRLLQDAFAADVGSPTEAIGLGSSGYVWFDVNKIDPARDRTFDEVRDRVLADWTRAERAKLLQAAAETAAAALRSGRAPQEVAADLSARHSRTEPLTRSAGDPRLGRDGVRLGFTGAQGAVTVVAPEPLKRTVLRVAEVRPPEPAPLPEAQAEATRDGVANDLLQQVIARLQSEYGATVNQPLIQSSLSQL